MTKTSLQDAWSDSESPAPQNPKAVVAPPAQQFQPPQQQLHQFQPQPQQFQPQPQQFQQFQPHPPQFQQFQQQQAVQPVHSKEMVISPDEFAKMFGNLDNFVQASAMAPTHTMTAEEHAVRQQQEAEVGPSPQQKQEQDARLLNNINQMMSESETFLLRKVSEMLRANQTQTQKTLDAFSQRQEEKSNPVDWLGIAILVLVVVLFSVVFVTQQCYHARTLKAIRTLNIERLRIGGGPLPPEINLFGR